MATPLEALDEVVNAMREALARQEARGYRDDNAVIDDTTRTLAARAAQQQASTGRALTQKAETTEPTHQARAAAWEERAANTYAEWQRESYLDEHERADADTSPEGAVDPATYRQHVHRVLDRLAERVADRQDAAEEHATHRSQDPYMREDAAIDE